MKNTGTPELIKATQDGAVSVDAAAKAAKNLTPEEQIEALKNAPGKVGKFVRDKMAEHEAKNHRDEEFMAMAKEANKKSRPANYDPARNDLRLKHLHRLYSSIESLSTMLSVDEIVASIPDYQHKQFEELETACNWLNDFRKAYEEANI